MDIWNVPNMDMPGTVLGAEESMVSQSGSPCLKFTMV